MEVIIINTNEMKKVLKDWVSDKRYNHSLAVAKEAVKLAQRYGADKEKAETAGLLHDIMKEANPDYQLELMTKGEVVLDKFELETKKLWHQIAGMVYCRDVLKIEDEDILNAINFHTSGRANMSLLEKIIFIADYTSEDRDYNGVKEIRKLAKESLELAMVEGLSFTVEELAEEKQIINPKTINAYNEAVLEAKEQQRKEN